MNFQKVIAAIVILSAGFGVFVFQTAVAEKRESAAVEAARCLILSFDEAFDSSEAIFVGKILSESKKDDVKTFEFEVAEYWKGANKQKIKINVYETTRYQAWFSVGERYLIYANVNDSGNLSVGRCSRSRIENEASEDLKKLGTGKKPA